MDGRMLKQLERASRVVVFCQERPSDLGGHQQAVRRLEETIDRANSAGQQETTARLAVREAVGERKGLGVQIHADLRLLARIARIAGEQSLGTAITIRFPGPGRNQVQFLSGGRVAVETAKERLELLTQYGLPTGHLEVITAGLDRFEEWLKRRDQAAQAQVAARRTLLAASREISTVVEQLHALTLHRFREDAAALRAWATASGVRTARKKLAAETGEAKTPPALPPGGTTGLITGS